MDYTAAIKAAALIGIGYLVGYNNSVKQFRDLKPDQCPITLQDRVGERFDLEHCVDEMEKCGGQFKDRLDVVMKGLYFPKIDVP
mgnify:CR=1 FL=1|tara:strand:- start:25 stop:276 length:252 start_codon:yes stop_codon:yes gene_type:complete